MEEKRKGILVGPIMIMIIVFALVVVLVYVASVVTINKFQQKLAYFTAVTDTLKNDVVGLRKYDAEQDTLIEENTVIIRGVQDATEDLIAHFLHHTEAVEDSFKIFRVDMDLVAQEVDSLQEVAAANEEMLRRLYGDVNLLTSNDRKILVLIRKTAGKNIYLFGLPIHKGAVKEIDRLLRQPEWQEKK